MLPKVNAKQMLTLYHHLDLDELFFNYPGGEQIIKNNSPSIKQCSEALVA